LLLLLMPCRLTDEQLGDNLLLIMLAGHDTSSTTLTNVMACLQVGIGQPVCLFL
jgi:cytochrome P450